MFSQRHIGPDADDVREILEVLGLKSLDDLTKSAMPKGILSKTGLDIGPGMSEPEFLDNARQIAGKNKLMKNFIGLGYYGTHTPTVILRNILENPGWYTAYTPYQAEISQGRMEALLNFQTMVTDLTGMELANASLLDEGTAAAEAMSMAFSLRKQKNKTKFFVDSEVWPQTLAVLRTRAKPLGIEIVTGIAGETTLDSEVFAALVQYPNLAGDIVDHSSWAERLHASGATLIVAADLLSLTLLRPPGEWGADIVVGSTQRFGVPPGFGGPHAAYMATRAAYTRTMPGRLIGVSKDNEGNMALRLTLQTREQHIRREKATSNICTAQVLLAVMASMYAVYHGPRGLRQIALNVRERATRLRGGLMALGLTPLNKNHFDTLSFEMNESELKAIQSTAAAEGYNFGAVGRRLYISCDELTTDTDIEHILHIFARALGRPAPERYSSKSELPASLQRQSEYLKHPVFNSYHSETEILRYIHRLEEKDLTLNKAMIPLGSCTMKLNATSEMIPVTWPEFAQIHPYQPADQVRGYLELISQLENWLRQITGMHAVSLQPNAGSQGEYAGLLVIRKYHESRGQGSRDVCLIPTSAHGTNPASAAMAGLKVIAVQCDSNGNIDVADLKKKCAEYADRLAALMVTYPSTHGVFEESIVEMCEVVHKHGGQVYMDGANLNALVGLSKPGEIGADVCHLNLHKTFCIPHGGGGPGVGPIAVREHLSPFLPDHPVVEDAGGKEGIGAISAAAWGSAGILPISWAYIAMMGSEGLKQATQMAILSANYIAKRLAPYYKVLYRGRGDWVAHECIIDVREFKETADITVDDIAKRLIDYGFHAPTMSWPVAGTLMIEPTESESLDELDRFCGAMIQIREEIAQIEKGKADRLNNVLKNAPHSMKHMTADGWDHPYSRAEAAYPLPWVREHKFWSPVGRVDNVYGDRNIMCTCPSVTDYQ